jgi:UDP-N-acetylmuramate dehydrogenase
MTELLHHIELKPLHTFRTAAYARSMVVLKNIEDFEEIRKLPAFEEGPLLILGGGSNMLFTRDWPGLIIKNELRGISIVRESADEVWVRAEAGESWHGLVLWAVERNLGGIENLSLIPGCCGAAPMQNIGAYGVELKEVFDHLEAIELSSGKIVRFTNDECKFGYRESIFKHEARNRFLISAIVLRLQKNPVLKLQYGDIRASLQELGIDKPGVKEVSEAVIRIRRSKLPDPAELGNAGSFFKNPVIATSHAQKLLQEFPEMPTYPGPDPLLTKVPAGWLIEQCGWKGKRMGQCGAHARQALVIVNYGEATGTEILELSQQIRTSVLNRFGIEIEPEVNVF